MVQRHRTCDLIYSAASYQSLAVLVAELWKIQSVAMTLRLRALPDSATVVCQQHTMAIVKVGYLPQTQAFQEIYTVNLNIKGFKSVIQIFCHLPKPISTLRKPE